MILSILLSMTIAAIPSIMFFLHIYSNIDAWFLNLGWPFTRIPIHFSNIFSSLLPQFAFDHFWFLIFIVPIGLICYGLFLGLLFGLFKLFRRGIPFLEDGIYNSETEEWLLYEYRLVYYIIFPYFLNFFEIFLNTRPRHVLFGAKIGENTIVGNGRIFNPERTEIGKNCMFGYNAILTGHVYEGNTLILKKVKIGNNVTIGTNAVIFPGVEVGDDCIIAANSTVPKDRVIPPNSLWVRGKTVPRDE